MKPTPVTHATPFARLGFGILLLAALFFALLPQAYAHRLSSSSLRLILPNEKPVVEGRLTVSLRDLAQVLPLDANLDAAITWGELRQAESALHSLVRERVVLLGNGTPLDVRFEPIAVDTLAGEPCASVSFLADRPGQLSELGVRYSLLFDADPEHRCLVKVLAGDTSILPQTAVLSPDQPSAGFPWNAAPGAPRSLSLATFIADGVHHIWIGFDHVLFLLALLLPSVLQRNNGTLTAAPRFSPVLVQVTQVVTAFTIAHSITLGLAAFNVVRLPSRLVETIIAASVAIAAFNNLVPFLRDRTWQVAFAFGLIHGFGFAGVLAELDLPRSVFAQGLLGFNLGVELGQLSIVAVFLPIAFGLRRSWFYHRLAFQGGSVAIIGLASLWVAQRAFDL